MDKESKGLRKLEEWVKGTSSCGRTQPMKEQNRKD